MRQVLILMIVLIAVLVASTVVQNQIMTRFEAQSHVKVTAHQELAAAVSVQQTPLAVVSVHGTGSVR